MHRLKLPVEEFTTPNPITATENTSLEELRSLMTENDIRHLPILREGEVVGIVSDRDLRVIEGLKPTASLKVKARDIMVQDPVTVSSEAPLFEVAYEMSSRKIGSVIVNEENSFLGIFTVTDALNALVEIAQSTSTSELSQ